MRYYVLGVFQGIVLLALRRKSAQSYIFLQKYANFMSKKVPFIKILCLLDNSNPPLPFLFGHRQK